MEIYIRANIECIGHFGFISKILEQFSVSVCGLSSSDLSPAVWVCLEWEETLMKAVINEFMNLS
jgi:hypothetical protein